MIVSIEFSPDYKVSQINCESEAILGIELEKTVGEQCASIMDAIHPNLMMAIHQWATTQEDSTNFAFDHFMRTGQYVVVDVYRLRGKFSCFIHIKEQINEKEYFEKKFKTFFFDTFEGGIIFLDTKGRVLDCTQGVLSLFKFKDPNAVLYTREAMLDKSLWDILMLQHAHVLQVFTTMVEKAKESLNDQLSGDISFQDVVCQFLLTPVLARNTIIGYYVLIHDLTQLRQKEQLIDAQRASIASSAKLASLGEMAGGIAHEINNPLAIIAVSIRAIRKMVAKGLVATEAFQNTLVEIDSTVVRISKIVSALRNVSRDASGEDFISCRIEDCLNDVLSLCAEKFKSHEVDLTVDIREELKSASIDLMRVQFSQVLLNLLTNAFDAAEKQELRWVKILVEESDHDISFKVTDSGGGIKEEYQDKIFQPFFTTKEIGKGTGLGLSLSNAIISKHMGRFYLDKESEHTCFVISIPKKHTQVGS